MPPYRNSRVTLVMDKKFLLSMLADHQLWLDSNRRKKQKACFANKNLSGMDLSNTNLRHADFSACDLSNCNLTGSDLHAAKLSGANLSGALLKHTNLSDANCKQASFRGAKFEKATLFHANMRGAYFSDAVFVDTALREISFEYANLEGVDLQGMDLRASDFKRAKLFRANLNNTNLHDSNFSSSDLRSTSLKNAFMVEANLANADLSKTQLQCANLHGANLTQASLERANMEASDLSACDVRGAILKDANLEGANVFAIKFDRLANYSGIRVSTCYGSAQFRRFAQDEDFIQEFKRKHPNLYLLWYVLTDCGRSLYRVLFMSFLVTMTFSLIYFKLGAEHFNIAYLDWNLFTLFYFSVITFTTLGFGDIAPASNLASALVMLEVIFGYMALGVLIAILADRIARRS